MTGRIAMVTGAAGGGIGEATARRLLVEGASVAVTDVHAARTAAVSTALGKAFGTDRVVGLPLDAGDLTGIDAVIEEVTLRLGPIDILVNNAGVNLGGSVDSMTTEQWERVMAVNLTGPWRLSARVLPEMRERQRGVIVNVGSIAAYSVDALALGPYSASKAALESLTRTIAFEGGPFGVRCVGVAPGIIATKWILDHADEVAQAMGTPALGRMGTPDEVAAVIAFLASDDASYVTGETLTVSGGLAMRG